MSSCTPARVSCVAALGWSVAAGNDVLLRRIDVLCGELRLVGAIGHASIVNPATVGLRQPERDRANGEK